MKHLKEEKYHTEKLYKMYFVEEDNLRPEGYGFVYIPHACGNNDDFLTLDEAKNSTIHITNNLRFKDRNFINNEINLFYDDTISEI